jgi:RNA polymerase sigma-70 factor (sigma-E family)
MDAAEAVCAAYQAYYPRLVAQVYALTGDLAEAQDVTQESFARVLAKPRGFLSADDPQRWLRTVALNLARTRFRRRQLFDRMVRVGRIAPAPPAVPGMTPDRLALMAALRRLPFTTRQVVVLHHVADLPVAEVAATLNLPIGTVKARLSRGRAALATYLAEDGFTPAEIKELRHA